MKLFIFYLKINVHYVGGFFIFGLNSTILCFQIWAILLLNFNSWTKLNPKLGVKPHLSGN